ncbi:WD40 repeat domain-containing protein [Planobispora takensis]|uniref:WD40 repeat domain-containing protein n=1 Tax=Planobispora takensis TaxID=1367882 RepID=A0A8J3WX08_9ACTN|nr:WD40 repeat domain-containing protein [Planobispora takensis]GII02377.1 hypothetical protein Pta02_43850 [Planobispora takensis]
MTRLHDTLHRIADEAPAVDLADRAVRGSRRRRRRRTALAAVAAVVVGGLVVGGGTGLLPFRQAHDTVASPVNPRSWEIESSPLPDRGVGPLAYAYLTSCPDRDAPPGCESGAWRVVTRDGETYDVPQAMGLSDTGEIHGPVVITPDGRAMAYYSRQDETLKVRDLESGKELSAPIRIEQSRLAGEVFLRLSDDGRHLAITVFGAEKPLAVSLDMRNGRTTDLPSGWMPVSVANDGGPVTVVKWTDTSSTVRLISPRGDDSAYVIPEYGQEFSALSPDGRTIVKIGMTPSDDLPIRADGTLGVYDIAEKAWSKVEIRGLPEDGVVMRLGHWLDGTTVTARTVVSSDGHRRDNDTTTVYAVNVTTGQARLLHTYPFPNAMVPGMVQ